MFQYSLFDSLSAARPCTADRGFLSRPILLLLWIEFGRSTLFFCCWTHPYSPAPSPPLSFFFFFFSPPILPSLTHSISSIQGGWRQPLSPRPVQLSPLRSFHSCSHSAHISHPWRDAAHFTHSARPIIHQTKTVRTLWSWRSASRCSCDSNPWKSVGINP